MAVPVLGNPPTFSGPDLPPASELLPCQLDSYARSGTATVLACEAIAPPSKASKPVKAGKAASKGATLVGSSVGEGSGSRQIRLWSITLAGGPLYPEGGGQPSDTGTLHVITAPHPSPDGNDAAGNSAAPAEAGTVTAEGAAAAPQAAVNDNRAAELVSLAARDAQVSETAHVAAVNILTVIRSGRSVLATVDAPLPVGASVAVSVDWARRFDLMQQHTAQHLLSAVADVVTGADTASWELRVPSPDGAADAVLVELETDALYSEQIDRIERDCNKAIQAARAVRPRLLAGAADLEAAMQSPHFRGKLPPPEKMQGGLRVVEIEGVDINACGGTHLASLAEIQILKLVGVERSRGQAVLRFLAGGRALRALGRAAAREQSMTKMLSCGPAEHESAVSAVVAERSALTRERKSLLEELAKLHAERLAAQLDAQGGSAAYHRDGSDLQFLSSVAAAVRELLPDALVLLTASTEAIGSKRKDVAGVFLLTGPADAVKHLGPDIAGLLGGKGGGRPGMYSGKATLLERREQATNLLHTLKDGHRKG